jgi:adenosine deaminase
VRMLPKAELHVHVEGTLEPELLVELARRNGVALPSTDPDELRAGYRFTSLQSFLDLYYRNVAVLRTEADFRELAAAYLARAAADGVRRAEIFFDPQQHLSHGVPLGALSGERCGRWSAHVGGVMSHHLHHRRRHHPVRPVDASMCPDV